MSTELANHYIAHVEASIALAKEHKSKLLPFHLDIDGMSSHKGRHLFNNLLSVRADEARPTRYLEVGTWKGSLLCAATFNNPIAAVAIDDFSQFTDISFIGQHHVHPRTALSQNLAQSAARSTIQTPIRFIDGDAFSQDPASLDLFDVYFYDGLHTFEAQKRAFTHFAPCLRDTIITMVDDYSDEATQRATQEGLSEAGFTVVKDWYLYEQTDQTLEGLKTGWWNGVYVGVCARTP